MIDLSVRMQFLVPPGKEEGEVSEFEREAISELETSLSTKIAGNSVKLLDTVTLGTIVREAFLVDPVTEVGFAIKDRNSQELKFAFGTIDTVKNPVIRAPLFVPESRLNLTTLAVFMRH